MYGEFNDFIAYIKIFQEPPSSIQIGRDDRPLLSCVIKPKLKLFAKNYTTAKQFAK